MLGKTSIVNNKNFLSSTNKHIFSWNKTGWNNYKQRISRRCQNSGLIEAETCFLSQDHTLAKLCSSLRSKRCMTNVMCVASCAFYMSSGMKRNSIVKVKRGLTEWSALHLEANCYVPQRWEIGWFSWGRKRTHKCISVCFCTNTKHLQPFEETEPERKVHRTLNTARQ